MGNLDYVMMLVYFAGLIAIGVLTIRKNRDTADMFAASGSSPWWISGTSAFMSMFSAGTFVVWGGIAYRYGLVSISISLTYGVAALFAGRFIAGKWNALKLKSPAEFIELRFGKEAVQFYVWVLTILVFAGGGAVYGLSTMVSALIEMPEGHFLADPETGSLSVQWASVIIVSVVVLYTMLGGLWAVLMTDVLQFIILTVGVVFAVPLLLGHEAVGGFSGFFAQAPEGFLSPTAQEFTWFFLGLWMVYHIVILGARWPFAQRWICVPSKKDARKAGYLFAVLYLISPWFWMLPPMLYRVIDAGADYEQAYMLAVDSVLPAGMVGLMIAALFSATASMQDSSFNVIAGAIQTEVYEKYIKKSASDLHYLIAGRVITVLLGLVVLIGALLIPIVGTYTGFILALSLIQGMLLVPTIWGFFSRKLGFNAVYMPILVSGPPALLMKFGLRDGGWFAGIGVFQPLAEYYQTHMRAADVLVGVGLPALVLLVMELMSKGESEGHKRIKQRLKEVKEQGAYKDSEPTTTVIDPMPARMVAAMLGILTVAFIAISFMGEHVGMILGFAAALGLLCVGVLVALKIALKRSASVEDLAYEAESNTGEDESNN